MNKKQEKLVINIIQADLHTTIQSSYIIVQLGTQKISTKPYQKSTHQPKWDEQFDLLYDQSNLNMKIILMKQDTTKKKKDELCGDGVIVLSNIWNTPNWEITVPLYLNSEDQGSVLIDFDFIGRKKPKANDQQVNQNIEQIEKSNIEFKSIDYQVQKQDLDNQIAKIMEKSYQLVFSSKKT